MSTVRSDNYANRVGDKSVPAETVVNGTAKAWINFDGTGSTNRASFNVSSRTNNGTGDYTVNFTNAMENSNYVPKGMGGSTTADGRVLVSQGSSQTNLTTGCRIAVSNSTTAVLLNYGRVYLSLVGDLA